MRDIEDLVAPLAAPAVHVVASHEFEESYLGGKPVLPVGIEWPQWQGRKLAFLARISLPKIQQAQRIDWLPEEGALLFFYDAEEQPWGFDPQDRGGCRVLHVPDLEGAGDGRTPLEEEFFPRIPVAFRSIQTLPSSERAIVDVLGLSDAESERYWELRDESFRGEPKHQIAGFPFPVQGDCMELECQLVSNGLYCGDSSGYQDPRADLLAAGADDWRLLFQIDTDDGADVMWGDCGTLYYWVRVQDAREGRFDNPWLILQCS